MLVIEKYSMAFTWPGSLLPAKHALVESERAPEYVLLVRQSPPVSTSSPCDAKIDFPMSFLADGVIPPILNAATLEPAPPVPNIAVTRSPKSVAFPVVDTSIASILLEALPVYPP